MQSKGAIIFFSIAFALVCIFQLSFTLVTYNVESGARDYAGGDIFKERTYLDSMMNEEVYNLGVKNYTYQECKERELNLGLDLKGGMHVTLEVSLAELVITMANFNKDPVFVKAIALAQSRQQESQKDFVTLFGEAFAEIDPNAKLAAIFATRELQDRITWESTNEDVLKILSAEADDAVNRSFQILRTRIDKFGVTQPNIQKLERSGRISIELPGVDNPERVRKLLQGTAKLEFWETYENVEVVEFIEKANKTLADKLNLTDSITNVDTALSLLSSTTASENISNLTTAMDTSLKPPDTTAVDELSLLQKIGTDTTLGGDTLSEDQAFQNFTNENPLYAVLSPAIYQDEQGTNRYRDGPVIGYVLAKDTGKVNEYINLPEIKSIFPKNLKFLWSVKPIGDEKPVYELLAIKITTRNNRAPLEGEVVTDARQDFSSESGKPEISMNMNSEGARTWKRMTSENIGKSIAIVLDNFVYSYPTVQSEIPSGRSSITGNFTINEAKDMANILKAGKLPAPAKIAHEAIVGPSLGKESIDVGLNSLIIGFILIVLFMILYYSSSGWVADLALFANLFFIIGVLASLGAALTLAGIAGIVLIMGMAVDANVLIYERVREELANGKGLRLAISDGFKKSYSAIVDSNVTTLLIGFILYFIGTGPVQGFAITLIIGILASMFTAIFITRIIFEWRLAANKQIKFNNKISAGAFKNLNFNFIGNRKIAYTISGIIILCGLVSFFIRGFNYGVDFNGGRSYIVKFNEKVKTNEVRSLLSSAFAGNPVEVKTFGENNRLKITTPYLINDKSEHADSIIEASLYNGLSTILGRDVSYDDFNKNYKEGSEKVGPTIADDIKTSALWAILVSLIMMFIYIIIRFNKWQYAAGATIALAHDVLIVLSLFSIFYNVLPFSLEVDQVFIAAILTIIGYSINDTVVVFDRIREHLNLHHGEEMSTVINRALNNTLSRTTITSFTTILAVIALFFFGGDVLRGFSFALLVGITAGTYSSIFIATPIVLDFAKKKKS